MKASKRGTERHDDEPSIKWIGFEDTKTEEDDGIDVDSLAAKREDQHIRYHAVLGHDLTKRSRTKGWETRFAAGQLMRVDMSEMFCPEKGYYSLQTVWSYPGTSDGHQ